MRALLLSAVSVLCLSASASAIEPQPCTNVFLQAEHVSLARVTGKKGDKAFFFSDKSLCPGKGNCRTSAYVIPGDEVLVIGTEEGWVCARYPGKMGEAVGWLKAGRVEILPEPKAPALADWTGTWRFYENFVKISADQGKGSLGISGEAFWHGGLKGEVEHLGRVEGAAVPEANRMVVEEDLGNGNSCIVQMTLLVRYLIVTDNQRCGGMNVSFRGVYTKAE